MANVNICDICRTPMQKFHSTNYKMIIKRSMFNFMGENVDNSKLDICERCMEDIVKIIRKERRNNNGRQEEACREE